MQIHVVQSGQTLYGIARTYGISVADLSAANQINPIQTLVIGQALVIPISGMYYFVQPGDTLYKIGRRFGVNHLRPLSALKRGLTEASPRLMFPRSRARQRAAGQC